MHTYCTYMYTSTYTLHSTLLCICIHAYIHIYTVHEQIKWYKIHTFEVTIIFEYTLDFVLQNMGIDSRNSLLIAKDTTCVHKVWKKINRAPTGIYCTHLFFWVPLTAHSMIIRSHIEVSVHSTGTKSTSMHSTTQCIHEQLVCKIILAAGMPKITSRRHRSRHSR